MKIGDKFERLTVIGNTHRLDAHGDKYFLCECRCGTVKEIVRGSLKRGFSRSCGCLAKEKATKHGMLGTLTYSSWLSMKSRCNVNSKDQKKIKYYSGKGIKICDQWKYFVNFYRDMGKRPSKNHTIDRIDNDKGYYPENCRWATHKQQNRNTSFNRIISYRGKRKSISEWCDVYGLKHHNLLWRINVGWPIQKALETPVKKYQRLKA